MATLMDILSGTGAALDLPGSMVRDTLGGQNPFDQLGSPFSWNRRLTGRDLLRQYGLAADEDSGANAMGGFLTEVATDPLTWLGMGALTRAMRLHRPLAATRAGEAALRAAETGMSAAGEYAKLGGRYAKPAAGAATAASQAASRAAPSAGRAAGSMALTVAPPAYGTYLVGDNMTKPAEEQQAWKNWVGGALMAAPLGMAAARGLGGLKKFIQGERVPVAGAADPSVPPGQAGGYVSPGEREVPVPGALVPDVPETGTAMPAVNPPRKPRTLGETMAAPQGPESGRVWQRPEILEEIRRMYESGLSPQQLAAELPKRGIPTFSGTGQWNSGNIWKITSSLGEDSQQAYQRAHSAAHSAGKIEWLARVEPEIHKLHREGRSANEITKILNNMGIDRPEGGAIGKQSVMKIILDAPPEVRDAHAQAVAARRAAVPEGAKLAGRSGTPTESPLPDWARTGMTPDELMMHGAAVGVPDRHMAEMLNQMGHAIDVKPFSEQRVTWEALKKLGDTENEALLKYLSDPGNVGEEAASYFATRDKRAFSATAARARGKIKQGVEPLESPRRLGFYNDQSVNSAYKRLRSNPETAGQIEKLRQQNSVRYVSPEDDVMSGGSLRIKHVPQMRSKMMAINYLRRLRDADMAPSDMVAAMRKAGTRHPETGAVFTQETLAKFMRDNKKLIERAESPSPDLFSPRPTEAGAKTSWTEDEITARFKELYLTGIGVHKIADKLNELGVPTMQHGKKWYGGTVYEFSKKFDADTIRRHDEAVEALQANLVRATDPLPEGLESAEDVMVHAKARNWTNQDIADELTKRGVRNRQKNPLNVQNVIDRMRPLQDRVEELKNELAKVQVEDAKIPQHDLRRIDKLSRYAGLTPEETAELKRLAMPYDIESRGELVKPLTAPDVEEPGAYHRARKRKVDGIEDPDMLKVDELFDHKVDKRPLLKHIEAYAHKLLLDKVPDPGHRQDIVDEAIARAYERLKKQFGDSRVIEPGAAAQDVIFSSMEKHVWSALNPTTVKVGSGGAGSHDAFAEGNQTAWEGRTPSGEGTGLLAGDRPGARTPAQLGDEIGRPEMTPDEIVNMNQKMKDSIENSGLSPEHQQVVMEELDKARFKVAKGRHEGDALKRDFASSEQDIRNEVAEKVKAGKYTTEEAVEEIRDRLEDLALVMKEQRGAKPATGAMSPELYQKIMTAHEIGGAPLPQLPRVPLDTAAAKTFLHQARNKLSEMGVPAEVLAQLTRHWAVLLGLGASGALGRIMRGQQPEWDDQDAEMAM